MRVRLQTHPRDLADWLIDELPDVDFGPRDFTHALHAVEAGGMVFYGVTPRGDMWLQPSERRCAPDVFSSRAVSKLEEALSVKAFKLTPEMTAVDVGAAPGAWTEYLSRHVARVAAVDPGELACVNWLSNVSHIRTKLECAREELATWRRGALFDLILCDVNRHPAESARLLLPMLPFLAPGGLLVMTLKFHGRGRSKGRQEEEVVGVLGEKMKEAEFVWLMANSIYERTFIGVNRD